VGTGDRHVDRKLPAELRSQTIKILVEAAAAGASLDDLKTIVGIALGKWRARRPRWTR
jgi:hypothetical protein